MNETIELFRKALEEERLTIGGSLMAWTQEYVYLSVSDASKVYALLIAQENELLKLRAEERHLTTQT